MNDAGIKILAAVVGFFLIMRGLNRDSSGRTLGDYILGQAGSANQLLPVGTTPGIVNTPGGGTGTYKPPSRLNAPAVDPVPGSTASRLDQGIDLTSKSFLAPYAGTVVASEASDSGWAGGGYVAIANKANPSQVEYFAEGILPTVQKGQAVTPGQSIGVPEINPYNATLGNIETGPANPKNPLQPLAQVVSNPAAVVDKFYSWLRGLGGPTATSTSGAGHA